MKSDRVDASRRRLGSLLLGAGGAYAVQGCGVDEGVGVARALSTTTASDGVVDMAADVGISPLNTGAQNSACFAVWAADSNAKQVLQFDFGVYEFEAETLHVPALRTLSGVDGTVLRCVSAGEWFVTGTSRFHLQRLEIDVADQADFGAFVASSDGATSGGVVFIADVRFRGALEAAVWGFGGTFFLDHVSAIGGKYGVLLEGCSESSLLRVACSLQTETGIFIRGSYGGGTSLYRAFSIPNGGRISASHLVLSKPDKYGVDLDGVAQTDIHGVTCEGAKNAAIRIRNASSNVRVFGARSNGGKVHAVTGGACAPNEPCIVGLAVEFDAVQSCYVYGACEAAQEVRYRNGAFACRAFYEAESFDNAADIVQVWEDSPSSSWAGIVRPDGQVLAHCLAPSSVGVCASVSAPTAGVWKRGDTVWNQHFGPGEPTGWRYDGTSWVGFPPETAEPLDGPTGSGSGAVYVDGVETLLANWHLHSLLGGCDGQRVVVFCNIASLWLSDFSGGNIQLDGGGAPGTLRWVMSQGDTCTLMRLSDSSGTPFWREIARSVA